MRATAQHGSWVTSSSTTKVTGWPATGAAGSMCMRTLTPPAWFDQEDPVGIVVVGIGGAPGGGNFSGGTVPVGSAGPGGQRVVGAVDRATVVTVLAGMRTVVVGDWRSHRHGCRDHRSVRRRVCASAATMASRSNPAASTRWFSPARSSSTVAAAKTPAGRRAAISAARARTVRSRSCVPSGRGWMPWCSRCDLAEGSMPARRAGQGRTAGTASSPSGPRGRARRRCSP